MAALVGRDEVLAALEQFLDDAAPEPAVLALTGEPGMGKTALWLEALSSAERRGQRVLQARPAESEAGLSYAGVTDLVGPVYDEVVGELPVPQARALGAVLLREEAEQPVELRAVATAVTHALARLAEAGPVVVAVDDVQWLDRASARALAFAARRLPSGVRLLLTARDGAGAAPGRLLGSLPAELVRREPIPPLSVPVLQRLVRDRTGADVTRAALTRMARSAEGNPLFALEIARAAVAAPGTASPGSPLPVPPDLSAALASRLDTLSGSAREALLVAATLSRPTAELLARALTAPMSEEALAEADAADLLVAEGGRLRFTHPLHAAAVYGAASPADRSELHRRLAGLVGDPEERARHLAAGTAEPDAGVAAELEAAAERAAFRGAQDTAADLFEAAWRLSPEDEPDDAARRRLGQAAALNAVGDFDAARSLAERSLDSPAEPVTSVAALLLLADLAWYAGDAARATELAEEALARTGADPAREGEIHARLARFHFSHDLEASLGHAELANPLLSRSRRPELFAQVSVDQVVGGALVGRPAPRATVEEALRLEHQGVLDGFQPQPMPLLWRHCTDDVEGARARFALEEQWYRERGEEVWVADRLSHLAVAELRAGEVARAEEYAEQSCDAVRRLDVAGPRAMVFEKQALVDAHRGRLERARATLTELVEDYERRDQSWWAALSLSTLAFTEYAAGNHRAADEHLTRMHENAERIGARDVLFDRSEPYHVECLLELGEPDRARMVLARLEERGTRLPRPWISASLPRTRALLLAADGDVDAALAAVDGEPAGLSGRLPFEHGWTLLVRGSLQRRARQKRAAADSLGRAYELFHHLGAEPFAERARVGLARTGLRQSPEELSPTELLVARFAASGMTNREVAQAAFISPKTVEANLAKVYRKLGIRSRAELGSRMAALDGAELPQT